LFALLISNNPNNERCGEESIRNGNGMFTNSIKISKV
jgi:hypothetical protein